jgi:hypothetical protein
LELSLHLQLEISSEYCLDKTEMPVFVSYDGPKLGKKQQTVVRSQVMVVVRDQQKKAKRQAKSAPKEEPRL